MKKHIDRCWEYMRCNEERTCCAYPDKGEVCWEVAGTMRDNEAEKRLDKLAKIAQQEGRDMTEHEMLLMHPMKAEKLCKYVERYGSCKCCPYYKYVEKMKKSMTTRKNFEAF